VSTSRVLWEWAPSPNATVVRATTAIKIRDDVPLDRACLVGCGVMTGVGAATNTARVRPGETVAVFGCARRAERDPGCPALRCCAYHRVDLARAKLALAKQFGATDTINATEAGDVPDAVRGLTGGLGVDYAFEVVGAPALITQAYMSLKRGGKAIVVGVPPMGQDVSIPGMMIALEEKSIIGSLYGSGNLRRDMPQLVDLYMQKRLKLDELVSRRIKIEDVNTAFDAMEKARSRAASSCTTESGRERRRRLRVAALPEDLIPGA